MNNEAKRDKREAARRQRLMAARKRQRAKRRKRLAIGSLVAIVLASTIAFSVRKSAEEKARAEEAALLAGCSPIESFEDGGQRHLQRTGEVYDEYNSAPPTSGPHAGRPAPWGSSLEEIPKETLVHSLEHGGIVVHYSDLEDAELDELDRLVDSYADGVISNPNKTIAQSIVMTSWTQLQRCDSFSEEAVRGFIRLRCGKGPERIATCR